MDAWFRLSRNQFLGFLREPAAAGFNLAVPFFILLVQALAFGSDLIGDELPGYRVVDVLPVGAAAMYIMIIGIFGMGVGLASMIETRTLAGFRLRPGGVPSIVSAYGTVLQLLVIVGLALSTVMLALGWNIKLPARPAVFVAAVLVGCLLFLAIGACVAGFSGSPRSAQGISSAAFFPLLFLSGGVFPIDTFPVGLRVVAKALPGYHLVEFLTYGWVEDYAIPWGNIAYVVVGLAVASAGALLLLSRREDL